MNTTVPESVEQIERELRSLEYKQMGLKPLPTIQVARDAVTDAMARHSVDSGFQRQLEAAQRVLSERLAQHEQFAELGKEIAAMQGRLAAAQQRVRAEMIAVADKRLARASQAYFEAQVATARAFRSLIEQVARSSTIQGANTVNIDRKLHLPSITPPSWSGTSAEIMLQGSSLPYEQDAA
jgi:hypothetical protein